MADPASNPIPLRRELRKPYFLYRTPDGLGTYLQRDVLRALFSRKEPLARFLALPQLASLQVKPPTIEYDLEGRRPEDFTPLDTLSDAELAAFEAAAREFLAKAEPTAERVSPHERELRAHFRLPDPDKEPDAYWVYGRPHDRRLFILWGCEFEPNSSLPLLPAKGQPRGASVVEKLAERRMRWEAKQAEALELLRRDSEPLATFVATPLHDANGVLKGVTAAGKTFGPQAISRPRHLPAREVRRLANAARLFYAKAAPEDTTTTAFEKEIRAALRFPSPEKLPQAYVTVSTPAGRRLHVLVDGKEKLEDTAPIIAHPTADAPTLTEEPVVDQLERRVAPTGKYTFVTLGALAAIGAALWFGGVFADKTAPTLKEIVAENDPLQVRLVFDKDLAPSSLYSAEEVAARTATTPPVDPPRSHIDIRDRAGKRLPIAQIAVEPNARATAIVTLGEALREESYTLYVEGIRGRSGPPLTPRLEKSFDYRDRLPPALVTVSGDSGDATRLILVFDEPIDDARAERIRNYRLPGFEFKEARLDPKDPAIIVLTATTPFTNRERYIIGVVDLRDRSQERNEITQEITREFVYRDTLPPKVEHVRADAEQIYLDVTFSEPVIEGPAQTPGNYVIRSTGEEKPFSAVAAKLVDGERTVRLRVPPLENGRDYTLKVLNVTDRATPPVKVADDEEFTFAYVGTPDEEGPYIDKIEVRGDGQRVTVTFNEPVAAAEVVELPRYRFNDPAYTVIAVGPNPQDPSGRSWVITPDPTLAQASPLRLIVGNLADLVGNRTPELVSPEFSYGLVIRPVNVLGFRSISASADGRTLAIEFTSEVTTTTARNVANYTISDGIPIQNAVVDETARDFRRVTLVLAQPLGRKKYTLTARALARNDDPNLVQAEMTETFNGPGSDF